MNPSTPFSQIGSTRTAIVFGDDRIDYGRFRRDIAAMESWLTRCELSPGQRLGIFLEHSYWSWVANLAAMSLGLVSATLTSNFRREAAVAGMFDAVLGHFASGAKIAHRLMEFSPQDLASLSDRTDVAAAVTGATRGEERARRLMFTSGTTGKPKCVLWDTAMLRSRVSLLLDSGRVNSDTRLISLLGMDTTGGFRYPLATWQAGGCVIGGQFNANGAMGISYTRASLQHCNLLISSPQRLEKAIRSVPQVWEGKESRRIVVAGGRLPRVLRDQALNIAAGEIVLAYGSTETGSIATGDSSLIDRHSGAVGFVVEGAEVQIVDDHGNPMPRGGSGRIRTRTPYMAHSYEGRDEGDADNAFMDGWFYPGDFGVHFKDGLLAIEGRASDIVNIGGGKISLTDLEAALIRLSNVQDIGAVILKSESGDELNLAVACDAATDLRELSQQISTRLPIVTRFRLVRVSEIPRNAMGKVMRPALAERLTRLFQG